MFTSRQNKLLHRGGARKSVCMCLFQTSSRVTMSHLRLRRGFQVTQAVAEPLGSQAELAILLLDAGHALKHHFIILSRQNTPESFRPPTRSVCARRSKRRRRDSTVTPSTTTWKKCDILPLGRGKHAAESDRRHLRLWIPASLFQLFAGILCTSFN